MSYADKIYRENAERIIMQGFSTEGEKIRAMWPDGTPAHTVSIFGTSNTYDLRKEFPVITLRRTALKSCFDEILWIYQKKSNKVSELNSHIWDAWEGGDGTIGKAYGYQVGKPYLHHTLCYDNYLDARYEMEEFTKAYPSGYVQMTLENEFFKVDYYMDQMDGVLYDLTNDPYSRRIMISLWNTDDLHEMNLQPCCWSLNFMVTKEKGEKVLNMVLNQRSNDFFTANNWNVSQYALLLMMIAQSVDMIPGKLVHNITNQHIYDRHIPLLKEVLDKSSYPAPNISLKKKNFYDITVDDLQIENYNYQKHSFHIPVAL